MHDRYLPGVIEFGDKLDFTGFTDEDIQDILVKEQVVKKSKARSLIGRIDPAAAFLMKVTVMDRIFSFMRKLRTR